MLIRSQNKKHIITLDDLAIQPKDGRFQIEAYNHGLFCKIAEYSSVEKAIKVLDLIVSAYEDIINGSYQYVWDMPQDDEVIE